MNTTQSRLKEKRERGGVAPANIVTKETTNGEETSTSPNTTKESTNDGKGTTTTDTQSDPQPVSIPRSENGGGGGGGIGDRPPITSPTKTVSIDNTTSATTTSATNGGVEADVHIASPAEWNPIPDNVSSVHSISTQPDDSGYDSDASTIVWTDPDLHNDTIDDFNNEFEIIEEEDEEEEFKEVTPFDPAAETSLHPPAKPSTIDSTTESSSHSLGKTTKRILDDPPPTKKIKLDGFHKRSTAPPSIGCINPRVIKDRMIYFNVAHSDPAIQKYAIPLRDSGNTLYVGISAKTTPPKTYFTERSEQDQNMSVWFSSLNTIEHFYDVCKNVIETGDPYFSWKNQKVSAPNSEIDFSFKEGVLRMNVKNSISGKQHKQFLLSLEMLGQFIMNYWKLQDFVKFLKLRSEIIAYGEAILLSVDKEISKHEFCELFLDGNQPNYVLNVGEIWKILESKYG